MLVKQGEALLGLKLRLLLSLHTLVLKHTAERKIISAVVGETQLQLNEGGGSVRYRVLYGQTKKFLGSSVQLRTEEAFLMRGDHENKCSVPD